MKLTKEQHVATIPESEGAPPIEVKIGFSGMVIIRQGDFEVLVDEPQVGQLITALGATP